MPHKDVEGHSDELTQEKFKGEIKVASRIVDYLSSGLYPSPAACLKELINNAYDADAQTVRVYVKPDGDRIVIEDDGQGMSREEFTTHFERISESHKRDSSELTDKFKRPKIGKIGIGFIAANEICEFMEIFSTKKGSRELLHVTINFSEMSKPIAERRKEDGDITKADYEGEVLISEPEEHYTQIFLERVRGEARSILVGAASQLSETDAKSLYGKKPETVVSLLCDEQLTSWKDFDFYSETMLNVALNTPIRYADGWVPGESNYPFIKDMSKEVEALKFNVFYDGTELRKPIVFSPGNKAFLIEPFEFKGKNVSARGYFYAQHGVVKPQELHGLLIRIRNSAVGNFDPSFWGFTPSVAQIIQRWVSAEIWADDRLEEAMNIDRTTLREAHPAYVELRDAIHSQLKKVFEVARKRLYDEGSAIRKEVRSQESKVKIAQALSVARESLPAVSVARIETMWNARTAESSGQKSLLKKYTVAEVYEVIIEVSQDLLEPAQLQELLGRLTKRLTK